MTNAHIGRKTKVLIGRESTWGTKASAFLEVPRGDGNENPKVQYVKDEGSIGRIETVHRNRVLHKWSEPQISGVLTDTLAGHLILAALGTSGVSADDPDTGSNTHSFTMQNDNAHDAFTLIYEDDVRTVMCNGCRLQSIEFSLEDDFVRFSANFVGKYPADTTESYSYTEENVFLPSHRTVKIASAIAGLSGASATVVDSLKFTIEKNVSPYFGGSVEPQQIVNKNFAVGGDFSATFEDETIYDLASAGTNQAMLVSLVNSDVTIGVAANPTIQFQFNRVSLEDWGKDDANDDIVKQNIAFMGEYKQADGALMTATVINEQSSDYDA